MVSTASRGGMIGLLVRELLMGSVLGHRHGLAARDRLPHRCWTVPCPFACCRKVRRATALFVHIGSGVWPASARRRPSPSHRVGFPGEKRRLSGAPWPAQDSPEILPAEPALFDI